MKKLIALLALALSFNNLLAQEPPPPPPPNKETDTTVFSTVQVPAEFPGGLAGWTKYLEQNLNAELGVKYVKIKKGQSVGKATVIVTFIVDKEGNISDVRAENKQHPKLVAEAIRVIKEGPKWIPATQNGRKVKYRHRQAITWQVSEE